MLITIAVLVKQLIFNKIEFIIIPNLVLTIAVPFTFNEIKQLF